MPTSASACAAFLTPARLTSISLLPELVIDALLTPSVLTRAVMMLIASPIVVELTGEDPDARPWKISSTPPFRSRPSSVLRGLVTPGIGIVTDSEITTSAATSVRTRLLRRRSLTPAPSP